MEGNEVAAADSDDMEYMAMDADKWSEHEDTYENGDTLGLDLRRNVNSNGFGSDSRGQKTEELKKEKAATNRPIRVTENPTTALPPNPPPDRYMTIRRPPVNANKGQKTSQLVFLRWITAGLVLMCFLLLGVLLFLGYKYDKLCQSRTPTNCSITQDIQVLKEKIDNLTDSFRPSYHVSETINCSTGLGLIILNHEVLEAYIKNEQSFYLFDKEEKNCMMPFSCNCTRDDMG